jgi:hypothetical protein
LEYPIAYISFCRVNLKVPGDDQLLIACRSMGLNKQIGWLLREVAYSHVPTVILQIRAVSSGKA